MICIEEAFSGPSTVEVSPAMRLFVSSWSHIICGGQYYWKPPFYSRCPYAQGVEKNMNHYESLHVLLCCSVHIYISVTSIWSLWMRLSMQTSVVLTPLITNSLSITVHSIQRLCLKSPHQQQAKMLKFFPDSTEGLAVWKTKPKTCLIFVPGSRFSVWFLMVLWFINNQDDQRNWVD